MQEMRAPTGEIEREYVAGKKGWVQEYLDRRRDELEAQGYTFVGRGKVGKNQRCPCESGRKFKDCCVSRVVRLGGATFFKGRVIVEDDDE